MALASRRPVPRQAQRRVRYYPSHDKGLRIGRLWDILTDNNIKAKQSIARIDAASARFPR